MKKMPFCLVFALLFIIIIPGKLLSQASCPDIVVSSFRLITDPVNPCLKKASVDFINPTNGTKSIGVRVTCGSSTIVINECHDASGQSGVTRNFNTAQFTCCDLSQLTVEVSSYTGNSTCLGTACSRMLSIAGAPLPVYFKSFTAVSDGSDVRLSWTTAFEQNNKGFEIQKQENPGEWKPLSFIFSKTATGNSVADNSYSYNDNFNSKGVLKYRIAQTDLDGHIHYSEVRTITVEGGSAERINIYPNPSNGSKVHIDFNESSIHDVRLYDANGSLLKNWTNINGKNYDLAKLTPGFYTIQVNSSKDNKRYFKKIIITN